MCSQLLGRVVPNTDVICMSEVFHDRHRQKLQDPTSWSRLGSPGKLAHVVTSVTSPFLVSMALYKTSRWRMIVQENEGALPHTFFAPDLSEQTIFFHDILAIFDIIKDMKARDFIVTCRTCKIG